MNHCCEEWFLDVQPANRCLYVWDHAFGQVIGLVTIG